MDKIRILIVDDNDFVRNNLSRILKDKYIIETASSKENAFKKFKIAEKQQFKYDLILLDNYLPEPDAGIEVLNYLKENNIDTIALMISEHTEIESDPFKTGMKAFKAGAVDFLTKPFKKDILAQKINNLISNKMKASATILMAESSGIDRFQDELKNIIDDANIDMITKSKAERLLETDNDEFGNSVFLDKSRDIEVSDSHSKSHNTMWDKRIQSIKDIPKEAQDQVFDILSRHKQIYRIKFGSFGPSGIFHSYKLKIKLPKIGEGKLFCTLYGPSPINCSRQDLIIFVNTGFEEKVKRDIETKLR